MGRWIVAGVLLVLLIGAVVIDEVGWEGITGGVVTVEDAGAGPVGEAVPLTPREQAEVEFKAAKSAQHEVCEHLMEMLAEKGGEELQEKVGDALYEQAGLEPPEVGALCTELDGMDETAKLAKLEELTGLTL